MQHTEKYKLNLIESSDPFLPDALNENARKLEGAMAAHEAAVRAEVAVVEGKITKFACGTVYPATPNTAAVLSVQLPFKPRAVLAHCDSGGMYSCCVLGTDIAGGSAQHSSITLTEDGFQVKIVSGATNYIAFG